MTAESADRTVSVFVPGWVLDDRALAPPDRGDLLDVELTFEPAGQTPSPCERAVQVTARPMFGHAPSGRPDGRLRWPHEVIGDGWSAEWLSEQPLAGRVELTGTLVVGIGWTSSSNAARVRGRVRRVRLVEQRFEHVERGIRAVDGTERLTAVETTPRRFWSDPVVEEDGFRAMGVLVDLDVHDVPVAKAEFVAGAVSVAGPDVWVMDRSDPVLLHIDTRSTPPRVVEYLLPLTIEPPVDQWTRRVHSDRGGCWITSRYEVFRCDRDDDGTLAVERVCTEGGTSVHIDGRLFLVGHMRPSLGHDRRYGAVRIEGDAHRLQVLDAERRLVPVEDPATIAEVTGQRGRADSARGIDGTEWRAVGTLMAQSPDRTRRHISLSPRSRGTVHWIQPDPHSDPANADIMARISFPPLHAATSDGEAGRSPGP